MYLDGLLLMRLVINMSLGTWAEGGDAETVVGAPAEPR